jgi:hypothetical protein
MKISKMERKEIPRKSPNVPPTFANMSATVTYTQDLHYKTFYNLTRK